MGETFLIIAMAIVIGALGYWIYQLHSTNDQLQKDMETLHNDLETSHTRNSKLLSQKKSSEVRLGFIAEKLAPFLDDFKWHGGSLEFLGKPIDYVHFGDDQITFIEVKSGKSRLNANQRKVKKLVKDGKVGFEIYRI